MNDSNKIISFLKRGTLALAFTAAALIGSSMYHKIQQERKIRENQRLSQLYRPAYLENLGDINGDGFDEYLQNIDRAGNLNLFMGTPNGNLLYVRKFLENSGYSADQTIWAEREIHQRIDAHSEKVMSYVGNEFHDAYRDIARSVLSELERERK